MLDYSKGVIYTIRCRTDTSLIYVGSTTNPLSKRWSAHKSSCLNPSSKHYNWQLYNKIRETGFENWYIELYEKYPCNDKQELNKREGEVIREIGNLNRRIEGRTLKEWYIENKERHAETGKIWHANNKEYLKEKNKERYQNNKEKYAKKYMENRDNINEKKMENFECECGCVVKKSYIAKHRKTHKHLNLMAAKN